MDIYRLLKESNVIKHMAMPGTTGIYNPAEFGTIDGKAYWEALVATQHFMMFDPVFRKN